MEDISHVHSFPTWQVIHLGVGFTTPSQCRAALSSSGCSVDSWANAILDQNAFSISLLQSNIELIKLTVADLGFTAGARYLDICARAKEIGLELCPAEVGPQLRLQYKGQPYGECVRIAMESISDDEHGGLGFFYVGHDEFGFWLRGRGGCPGRFWAATIVFIFARRRIT